MELPIFFTFFTLFFLGIAPLFQYLEDIVFWTDDSFTDYNYIKTNLILISALIQNYEFIVRIFKHKCLVD